MDNIKSVTVFLSHNSLDKPAVEELKGHLESQVPPVRCWLDKHDLLSQGTWVNQIENAIAECEVALLFYGPSGFGRVHDSERELLLSRAMEQPDTFRVIPVLLPGACKADVNGFAKLHCWVDFSSGLDSPAAMQRLIAFIRGEAPVDTMDDNDFLADCEPYRGLQRFEPKHATFFFGRDNEIKRLCKAMEQSRFIAVIGASGSGKSSLVRAGLQSEIALSLQPQLARSTKITVLPGSVPLRSLAEQIVAQVVHEERRDERPGRVDEYMNKLQQQPTSLRTILSSLFVQRDELTLLVIDQFEEIFTHSRSQSNESNALEEETELFLQQIVDFAMNADRHFRVVITLRADFLASCLNYPALRGLLENNQILLGDLSNEQMREAIILPARQVGAYFEKGLVERLLTDVAHQQGVLPLLQHTLRELWLTRRGRWMTNESYTMTGGVAGALKRSAESTFEQLTSLSPTAQAAAREIFVTLTTFGDGVPDTRRRVSRAALYTRGNIEHELLDAVLERLVDARLIRTDSSDQDKATLEVTHEALIKSWPRYREWIVEDKELELIHRKLEQAAQEWSASARDSGLLLRGVKLSEAFHWRRRCSSRASRLLIEFLGASERMRRIQNPVLTEDTFAGGLVVHRFKPRKKLVVKCHPKFTVRGLLQGLFVFCLCILVSMLFVALAFDQGSKELSGLATFCATSGMLIGIGYPLFRQWFAPKVRIDLVNRKIVLPDSISASTPTSSDVSFSIKSRKHGSLVRLIVANFELVRMRTSHVEPAVALLRPFAYALNHQLGFGPVLGDHWAPSQTRQPEVQSIEDVVANSHLELVKQLFESLVKRDWQSLRVCLHPHVAYDGIELSLSGEDVATMWNQIGKSGIEISIQDIHSTQSGAVATWCARYIPSCGSRPIHIPIQSHFLILDGAIRYQRDVIPRYQWARKAFGWRGWLAGWTGEHLFLRWVRKQSQLRFEEFRSQSSRENLT